MLLIICLRGSDFRESFSRLGGLRALTKAPFMALTASAPPDVEAVILSSLHLHEPVLVSQPLDRANIYLSASRSVGLKVRVGLMHACAHFIRLCMIAQLQHLFLFFAARLRENSTCHIRC